MYIESNGFGVHRIVNGPLGVNTYIIVNGQRAVVIDPASRMIGLEIDNLGLEVEAVLLTHGHFDHIKGMERFVQSGVSVYVHEGDVAKCEGREMADMMKTFKVTPFTPDKRVQDGDILHLIGLDIRVIYTPGHSRGGVTYQLGDILFTGDTLLAGTCGRYDFEDGNLDELKDSIINKLFALDGNYRIFPGHGGDSTLDRERNNNTILWI